MSTPEVFDNVSVPEQFGISATLEMNSVSTGAKAVMKKMGTANDMFMIDPRKLRVIEGFNTRIKDARYWERVEFLVESIEANGFFREKPLSCFVVKEAGEDEQGEPCMVDVIYVVEGGRRLDASLIRQRKMSAEDAGNFVVPCVPKDRSVSDVDLTYGLAEGNSNEPFRPYELAVLVKRLKVVLGQTDEQILKRLPSMVSASHLPALLTVAGAPRKIAELVISEELSVTTAAKIMNQYGNKAIEFLEQAKANAKAAGKDRITDRFMPGVKLTSALKKEAPELYKSAKLVMADPAFSSLSEETRAVLEDLMRDLKAHEDVPMDQANDDQIALDSIGDDRQQA
jgi:ParB family chromosome partitioning protein